MEVHLEVGKVDHLVSLGGLLDRHWWLIHLSESTSDSLPTIWLASALGKAPSSPWKHTLRLLCQHVELSNIYDTAQKQTSTDSKKNQTRTIMSDNFSDNFNELAGLREQILGQRNRIS